MNADGAGARRGAAGRPASSYGSASCTGRSSEQRWRRARDWTDHGRKNRIQRTATTQGGRYFIYRPPRTVFHPPSYRVVASTRPRRSARRRCNSARTARALTLVVASHLNHGRARFSWPSAMRRAYSRGQDEAGGGTGCGLPSPCSPACRTVERARRQPAPGKPASSCKAEQHEPPI